MRIILIGLFVAIPLLLLAQSQRIAKVLPLSDTARVSGGGLAYALEVNGGLNLVSRRRNLLPFADASGLRPHPGVYLGLGFVFSPEGSVSLKLGADYAWDRALIKNYGFSSSRQAGVDFNAARRTRFGEVTISEHFVRFRIEGRFNIDRVSPFIGLQINSYLGGAQRFDYTQTTRALREAGTFNEIELPTPLVNTGSSTLNDRNYGGYASLPFGVAYAIRNKLSIRIEYDLGVHVAVPSLSDEVRQGRHRVSIGANYRILSR